MENENIVEQTTAKNEEVVLSEEDFAALPENAQKHIKTLSAQKKHFRDKADKGIDSDTGKSYKELYEDKSKVLQDPKEVVPEKMVDNSKSIEEKVDARLDGYSKEEISFASKNRSEGQSLEDALKSPFVQAGIDGLRKEAKAEDATPSPSSRRVVYKDKTFAEVSVDESLSKEEKQAAFVQHMKTRG